MSFLVHTFTTTPNSLSLQEIARYMGMRSDAMSDETRTRISQLMPRYLQEIRCKACWMEVPVKIEDNQIDFAVFSVHSSHLARNLLGCDCAILFSATLGNNVDRLCRSASVSSPANALIYDAMGSTAIEWFCDELCDHVTRGYPTYVSRPRFSPGYGDLPLALQSKLIDVLDARRTIGLVLSDSLMIPQKSVTAIMGLVKRDK